MMKPVPSPISVRQQRGFTLPAVLVISAAMLVLAVGLLSLVGIERKTARSFSDSKRAELAARAGLEQFRALLKKETANDDFLVLADLPDKPRVDSKLPLPNLFLARGQGGQDNVSYRYLPLFSSESQPDKGILKAPKADELVGNAAKEFTTVPGFDMAKVSWITIDDEKGQPAGRYAYWVEDLQGKIDTLTAGNLTGNNGNHGRAAYPFPAAGVNPQPLSDKEPRLNQVAVHVLDPASGETPSGDLTRNLIENRPIMLSPESAAAAANLSAPLARDKTTGLYADKLADSLDRNASPAIHAYKERPMVPFARGISADVAGQPKVNLNHLLAEGREAAIDEFATWVDKGLPTFVGRKGGFPEDYLRTLGAEALDYADADSDPTVKEGVYRGLDAYPLLSEIVLQINFLGTETENGVRYLKFRNRLFVELWNMTDKPVTGMAKFSYEVDLHFSTGIGAMPANKGFDDPSVMTKATHNLTLDGGTYWTPDISVALQPDQYRFYDLADVNYRFSGGDASDTVGKTFTLTENEDGHDDGLHPDGRGMRFKWNGLQVDRCQKIKHIDKFFSPDQSEFQYKIDAPKTIGKGSIPGHSYKSNNTYCDDMGDPRTSYYLRVVALDENKYPGNVSPNRRNIRRDSIYDADPPTKPKFWGRAQPSDWPDGGHDSSAGTWGIQSDPKVIPTDTKLYPIPPIPADSYKTAPQRISNAGRFYSATELGRIYDPLMWSERYDNASDDAAFTGANPVIPASQHWQPEVLLKAGPSTDYGGGSTLRIGRPEHPRFDLPGQRAANLLDLFHAGESTSENEDERDGDLITIAGNVNLNTASRDAIRALAAGMLTQDPAIGRVTNWSHDKVKLAPPVVELSVGTPTTAGADAKAADRVADAIILCRPFASAGELAATSETPRAPVASNKTDTGAVFGNRKMYNFGDNLQWNDAAAEEVFARVYEASTLRSRNFRVWVVGQALGPASDSGDQVLAESHKVFTIFADPGDRKSDGSIDPSTYRPRVIHENDF